MPRSFRFEQYLRSLPIEERRRIERAEAEYLASTQSRNAALERDFADSMVGIDAGGIGPWETDHSIVGVSTNPGLASRSSGSK